MKKVAFRVDASSQIGTGHFMRCLTLADALKQRGVQIRVLSRHLPWHLKDMLAAKEHEFMPLNSSSIAATSDDLAQSHWLGTSQHADAQETIQALSGQGWDWLVVDHYALDFRWESALRTTVSHIMVIDDLADRVHNCDLLLDQNLVAQMRTRYAGKVSPRCEVLLGPEYALLQPIYAELHGRISPRKCSIQRIFIFFGGTDNDNLTGRTLAAFLALNRQDVEVDVVITASFPHAEAVRRQVAGKGNIRLYSDLPTLAPLMAKANLAVGGGGATSWERLCLGLPSIVVTVAANQLSVAIELERKGLIRWIGHASDVSELGIANALQLFLNDGIQPDWFLTCESLVDGRGAMRVCESLLRGAMSYQ